ncbi:hypothetical protein GQ55_7G308400 [Panicum hallii var. hallii]|uniref:Uncharacterized protein n=1 Tax=Panicum hallii var. hallii TaxID=1504633 RepID=A0A2T7D0U0_9POAL|nr:hypothetical protein GQ55_7G308400 [Panicum hallii var. hallii]
MSGSISAKESNWIRRRRRRLRSCLILRRFSDSIAMTPEPRAQWRRAGGRSLFSLQSLCTREFVSFSTCISSNLPVRPLSVSRSLSLSLFRASRPLSVSIRTRNS